MPTQAELIIVAKWLKKHSSLIPPVVRDEIGTQTTVTFGSGRKGKVSIESFDEKQVGITNHRPAAGTPDALAPWDSDLMPADPTADTAEANLDNA